MACTRLRPTGATLRVGSILSFVRQGLGAPLRIQIEGPHFSKTINVFENEVVHLLGKCDCVRETCRSDSMGPRRHLREVVTTYFFVALCSIRKYTLFGGLGEH